jgi:sporulation delaying protein A
MASYPRRPLRRGFRRFIDAFRTPDCNETVRRVPVSRTLFAALAIAVTSGALWTAFAQLPSNILTSNRTSAGTNLLVATFPQWWAFFTSSPTAEQYYLAEPASLMNRLPYAEPRNLFGLDRAPKTKLRELNRLVRQIRGDQWQSCTSDDQCRNLAVRPIAVRNQALNPTYCGAVTVIGYTVAPWADRRLVSGSTIDSRAVKLDIQCIRD